MDILYGKPAESVRRFSRFKWVTAAVLLALLLLTWFSGAHRATDSATGVAAPGVDARPGSAAGGAPQSAASKSTAAGSMSFAIDLANDGSLKVQGTVADEGTRNRWLNAIRIGAQGARVSDELKIGQVSPAAGWIAHLSSLVAVMRERKLAGLRVDGDKVLLKGAVGSQAEKADVDKMIRAQLPAGYRLESQLAISTSAAGGSAGSSPTGSAAPGASAPSSPTASSSSSSSSAAAPVQRPDSTAAGATQRADADKAARRDASGQDDERASKAAARKPANCPREIRSLARSIYFKTDAAGLSPPERTRLLRLGGCLGRASVRIVGHADPRHTDEYNLELSERRAQAVADALAAGGASRSRISVVAAGRTKATAEGASRQALQRSRRVDIQIR